MTGRFKGSEVSSASSSPELLVSVRYAAYFPGAASVSLVAPFQQLLEAAILLLQGYPAIQRRHHHSDRASISHEAPNKQHCALIQ